MKHGNNLKTTYFFLIFFFSNIALSEEKILSSPLINLEEIQPSFEVPENDNESFSSNLIKEKKIIKKIIRMLF